MSIYGILSIDDNGLDLSAVICEEPFGDEAIQFFRRFMAFWIAASLRSSQ